MIREMKHADWAQVKRIYEEGIATGYATFETQAPSFEDWDAAHLQLGRYVYVDDNDEVLGWVALSPVSGRCIYGGVADETVYVAAKASGKGIATALFEKLIPESEKQGYWTIQAGIFAENKPSLKLHKKVGFRVVGVREKLGKLGGNWHDVVLLERRSSKI